MTDEHLLATLLREQDGTPTDAESILGLTALLEIAEDECKRLEVSNSEIAERLEVSAETLASRNGLVRTQALQLHDRDGQLRTLEAMLQTADGRLAELTKLYEQVRDTQRAQNADLARLALMRGHALGADDEIVVEG